MNATDARPTIGDIVTITASGDNGWAHRNGQVGEIIQDDHDSAPYRVRMVATGEEIGYFGPEIVEKVPAPEPTAPSRPTKGDTVTIISGNRYVGMNGLISVDDKSELPFYIDGWGWFTEGQVAKVVEGDGHTLTVSDPAPVEAAPDPKDAEIERLRALNEQQRTAYSTLREEYRVAVEETIGQRMVEEATNRGWCSEFGRIIDEVNEDLPTFELPKCEEEWDTDWYDIVEVKVARSRTYTATGRDDAISQAQDDDGPESSDIIDAIRNGSFDWVRGEDYEASRN